MHNLVLSGSGQVSAKSGSLGQFGTHICGYAVVGGQQ